MLWPDRRPNESGAGSDPCPLLARSWDHPRKRSGKDGPAFLMKTVERILTLSGRFSY